MKESFRPKFSYGNQPYENFGRKLSFIDMNFSWNNKGTVCRNLWENNKVIMISLMYISFDFGNN